MCLSLCHCPGLCPNDNAKLRHAPPALHVIAMCAMVRSPHFPLSVLHHTHPVRAPFPAVCQYVSPSSPMQRPPWPRQHSDALHIFCAARLLLSQRTPPLPLPRIVLHTAARKKNVGGHDGDMSERKLTELQKKILNLIKESPTITGKQMSETLSVSQRTIERDLSALQKSGILKHEGKDNDGVWIIQKMSWH